MTYTLLAVIGILGALVVDLFVLKTKLVGTGRFWFAYGVLVGFQLLTNGWLTGRGIVQYDEEAIIGVRVAYAPIEDIAFGFALILLTLSVWRWLSKKPGFSPSV
jgi:lycopene cyclase domain-containing protein